MAKFLRDYYSTLDILQAVSYYGNDTDDLTIAVEFIISKNAQMPPKKKANVHIILDEETDSDVDSDIDSDVDSDIDSDVDSDVDLDIDSDSDVDSDGDSDNVYTDNDRDLNSEEERALGVTNKELRKFEKKHALRNASPFQRVSKKSKSTFQEKFSNRTVTDDNVYGEINMIIPNPYIIGDTYYGTYLYNTDTYELYDLIERNGALFKVTDENYKIHTLDKDKLIEYIKQKVAQIKN